MYEYEFKNSDWKKYKLTLPFSSEDDRYVAIVVISLIFVILLCASILALVSDRKKPKHKL